MMISWWKSLFVLVLFFYTIGIVIVNDMYKHVFLESLSNNIILL